MAKKKGAVVKHHGEEVLSKKESGRQIREKLYKARDEVNEELRKSGHTPNLVVKTLKINNKEYDTVTIKKDHEFNKVFRVALREVMQKQGMSKNARLVFGTLISFITFPTNTISINGDSSPSNEDLEELLDLSPVTLKKVLNELEHHEVIKRKMDGNLRVIYFNPFLVCAGGVVDKTTFLLFKDSIFNNDEV
ncbi:MAG: hypothetical protein U0X74_02790 [Anaerolineales bacterium]